MPDLIYSGSTGICDFWALMNKYLQIARYFMFCLFLNQLNLEVINSKIQILNKPSTRQETVVNTTATHLRTLLVDLSRISDTLSHGVR